MINDHVKIRLPIGVHLLKQILFEAERYFDKQPYLQSLYKALFSITYYGMMRIGEVSKSDHHVKAKDMYVAFNKDKIMLRLHTSKMHGMESEPQEIKINKIVEEGAYMLTRNRFFCPFDLMRQYIGIRGAGFIRDNEAFFILTDR